MKIIFAGTPAFAVPSLQQLKNADHEIVAVYTQPDRPAGRGRHLKASPIKQLAKSLNLPIKQPERLRDEKIITELQSLNADCMVVVAYGLILPKPVLDAFRFGCINVHASLLPRWRGAAPIQHALLEGDHKTGITIMQMDTGLDNGDILYQDHCAITHTDTAQQLHDRLALLGANGLVKTLPRIEAGKIHPSAQDESLSTYAHKITKEQAKIDWQLNANLIERQIRAYNPWPVAFTLLNKQNVRIWHATITEDTHQATPGTILQSNKQGINVATGNGVLRLQIIQLPGGKPLPIEDVLNAHGKMFAEGVLFE